MMGFTGSAPPAADGSLPAVTPDLEEIADARWCAFLHGTLVSLNKNFRSFLSPFPSTPEKYTRFFIRFNEAIDTNHSMLFRSSCF